MDLEEWWGGIPPLTKGYLVAAFATSAAVTFEIVSPLVLLLSIDRVLEGEWWRLFTTFLFFDRLGIGFFFHMHFLYIYFRRLEEHFYLRRTGEFLFMILAAAASLLFLAPLMDALILSGPLMTIMLYLWARRFPDEHMQINGLFNVSSAHLPYVMLGFTVAFGGVSAAAQDCVAMVVGHVLWYLADVMPQITGVHVMNPTFLTAPFRRRVELGEAH